MELETICDEEISTPKIFAVEESTRLRKTLSPIIVDVMIFKEILKDYPLINDENRGEQIANIMLAYRHLEDAKMRLGKVIQATVGKSVYDK